jgi:hypothetical protein
VIAAIINSRNIVNIDQSSKCWRWRRVSMEKTPLQLDLPDIAVSRRAPAFPQQI